MVVRTVVVRTAKELAAAGCAHALRGGGGGGGVGGLHRYSHRAAQLEEEQDKREKRAARCECGRHCISARGVRSRKRACRPTIRVGAEESDALSLARWALPSSLAFRARHARFPHKFQIPAKLEPQSHVLENPLSSFCPDNVFPTIITSSMTVCH